MDLILTSRPASASAAIGLALGASHRIASAPPSPMRLTPIPQTSMPSGPSASPAPSASAPIAPAPRVQPKPKPETHQDKVVAVMGSEAAKGREALAAHLLSTAPINALPSADLIQALHDIPRSAYYSNAEFAARAAEQRAADKRRAADDVWSRARSHSADKPKVTDNTWDRARAQIGAAS